CIMLSFPRSPVFPYTTLFRSSVTVLFYLLTPFFTPSLPSNRLQILYFYLAIVGALVIWRLVYVNFINSPRFYKKVLIVGETSNIDRKSTRLNSSHVKISYAVF